MQSLLDALSKFQYTVHVSLGSVDLIITIILCPLNYQNHFTMCYVEIIEANAAYHWQNIRLGTVHYK